MENNAQSSKLTRLKKFCRSYYRDVVEISIRATLLLICTVVLNLIVLFFYRILWHIFRMTYSGKRFIMLHPEANNLVSNIVNNDLIEISIQTTFSAFIICLIIGAVCRITYIKRYLYHSLGALPRLVYWGGPLTVLVSWYLNEELKFAHWSYTLPITFLPTLCVFSYCFKFSETLLPEIGDVIVKIISSLKSFFSLTTPQER